MTTFAVIVTYGNRFHFLKQVIESTLKEGITKVIVVDNNSVSESREKLKTYEQELGRDKIKVLYLDDNYGSAGGYKRGLQEVYNDKECEFIWLLDDDNKPQKGSLKALKDFWNNLDQEDKNEKVVLLSYRRDRTIYKEAIVKNKPDLVLGRKNSFLGFHIIDLPKKVLKVIKRKFGLKTFIENTNVKSGKVSVAPYGGMFFHKNIIDTIGYPKEELYLYADDHEWSYRITKSGGDICLVLDSLVDDIDTSWNVSQKKEKSFNIIANGSRFRMHYSTRNRVFFESKNLVSNRIIYKLNILFYSFLVKIADKSKQKQNYKIFKQAIFDGLKNKLGKNEDINL